MQTIISLARRQPKEDTLVTMLFDHVDCRMSYTTYSNWWYGVPNQVRSGPCYVGPEWAHHMQCAMCTYVLKGCTYILNSLNEWTNNFNLDW